MFDPAELTKSILDSKKIADQANQDASSPFMSQMSGASVAGVNVQGGSNASNVIGGASAAIRQMTESLDRTAQSAQEQVDAHQAKQKSARPEDFDVNVDDLRPTDAKGFPLEDPESFFAQLQERTNKIKSSI